MYFYDQETKKEKGSVALKEKGYAISKSPSPKFDLIIGDDKGFLNGWNLRSRSCTKSLKLFLNRVNWIELYKEFIFAKSFDLTLKMINFEDG